MSEHRRIALLGPMYPYRGGIAHLSETMATKLISRGHQVYAITFKRQYPEFLFPGKTQYENELISDQTIVAERLVDSINPFSWRDTVRFIQKLGIEIVVFRYWMPFFAPAFGSIARRLSRRGIKSVAIVDNAIPHEHRLGDILLGRYFFKAMSGCVVMSHAVDQDLDRLNVSCPRTFAPHPVYDSFGEPVDRIQARKRLNLDVDAPIILFFGFVRRYKGLHVLLNSLQKIRDALPNICLLVAGEFYEDEALYREQIKTLGIEEQVRLVNQYLPKNEVAVYFAAADAVVQPYLSATQSGVAQVAYQFEVPIITTDVGGLSEAVPNEEAGLIVPSNDHVALADAVIRYFNEDMREKLLIGVKRQKESLGWERFIDAIESIL